MHLLVGPPLVAEKSKEGLGATSKEASMRDESRSRKQQQLLAFLVFALWIRQAGRQRYKKKTSRKPSAVSTGWASNERPKISTFRFQRWPPRWLSGATSAARDTSLLRPLPGLQLPPCLPDQLDRHPTHITTLPNGVRVASEDLPVLV